MTRVTIVFLVLAIAAIGCASGSSQDGSTRPNGGTVNAGPSTDNGQGTIPPQPELTSGESLFRSRCTQCHGLENIENSSYSGRAWSAVVDRMRQKQGSRITEEEAELITEYLATEYRP